MQPWFGLHLPLYTYPGTSSAELFDRVVEQAQAATIQSWRRRHADFPSPSVELVAGPIWLWSEAKAWIDQRSLRREAAHR